MIDLSQQPPRMLATWETLIELSERKPSGWVLIGAQMVILHGLRKGRNLGRATADADVVVDVRVVNQGIADLVKHLQDMGFDLENISAMGVGHRFTNGYVSIDVLAPDVKLRKLEKLQTVPPAHTVSVPGSNQALRRIERIEVQTANKAGIVPSPNLLGAILVKSRAVDVDDVPESQLADLTFLLSLVDDPRMLLSELIGREKTWISRRKELLDKDHPAWHTLPDDHRRDAYYALKILSSL